MRSNELEATLKRLTRPETQIKVLSVEYDELNVLVVEVQEKLNVWFVPLPSEGGRRFGGSPYDSVSNLSALTATRPLQTRSFSGTKIRQ
ncbi:hypothetical protein OG21DRAFT_1492242 [Imleria badia]|nr:hypothetical protein OG21DRAFT_1492242 [Imleria badia]